MTEQNHLWCRDVRRDEAVRAAEDAAAVPAIQHRDLPEVVAALTERVARLEAAVMPKSVSGSIAESLENKGGAMPAEGLRTERVTLEVTQRVEHYVSPSRWNWCRQLGSHAQPGESVRVVDKADAASDEAVAHGATLSALAEARESLAAANRGIARLTAERDAAIRERDAARARVAELEAAAPPRGWLTAEERELIAGLTDDDHYTDEGQNIAKALLARETPPRVKVPTWMHDDVRRCVIDAIRAAGGEVEG